MFNYNEYLKALKKFLAIFEGNQDNLNLLMNNNNFNNCFFKTSKLYDTYTGEKLEAFPVIEDQFVYISDNWNVANFFEDFLMNKFGHLDSYIMHSIITNKDSRIIYFITDYGLPLEVIPGFEDTGTYYTQEHHYIINKFSLVEDNKILYDYGIVFDSFDNVTEEELRVVGNLLNDFGTFDKENIDSDINNLDGIILKYSQNNYPNNLF